MVMDLSEPMLEGDERVRSLLGVGELVCSVGEVGYS